ncbi:protein RST1 isoform X1 [Ricinus communis]|uniref:protein RST1 isoform X1 n=1 Tax=Ricinus communis TaxID=3988 RepID=UPI000772A4AD|nr:protein RST1 isoform X1 [Ricinus communis]|eukprot:XP_015576178.1 protein RST1 isoform X1 [Ricinus communis]
MDSYTPLLEKTRVPQPSIQKFAVISIFSKLRSAPKYLDPDSDPGRDAISQCLHSSSPAVVDQTVRELCRLVSDSTLDISRGLLELQSALEGTDEKFVSLFVKGLGFLIRVGFNRNHGSWRFGSPENHPFVRILLCRTEVQTELVQQVLLFMAKNMRLGMVKVCEFLKPLAVFSILSIPFSNSTSSLFARQLIPSMASFCCSLPEEALPVLKLLMGCLKYLPHKNSDELRDCYYFLECVVDAYTVVLRSLVQTGLLVTKAQLFGVELSETILSLLTHVHGRSGGAEPIVELVKRLIVIQKDLSLCYIPELSSVILSSFAILIQSELEHEQLSLLKLVIFLVKWKGENECAFDRATCALSEEVLFTFPVINLMSSTSRSMKGAAADLLIMLEKLLVKLFRASRIELVTEGQFPSISSPGSIVYRLLQQLWFQDQFSPSTSFFVNFASSDDKGMHDQAKFWASQLREYSMRIIDRRKSSFPVSQTEETFLTEIPRLLSAITGVLVMHQSLGYIAVDLLATIGIMDPKQGVPLLLAVLFYSNIFTRNDAKNQEILPKLLSMLPSLASHFVMIPLVIQTILPMLQKDGKRVLYATGARLLCQTWAINDRAFSSLQAVLLPEGFTEFKSERTICIGLATSIRDVCRKNPDRGVDIILSVSACIESQDPIIRSFGLQSLAYLCEADVIDFYTAWDVIAKYVLGYSSDPVLAQSICMLLRWGAMDAEAYPEASRNVLQILWHVGASKHGNDVVQWAKARAYAFQALSQYEVSHLEKGILDFKRKNTDLLLSETDNDVLKAMEGFQVKIITHEHMNRRRLAKEKKTTGSKIEKLLDVLPQVLFPSGKKNNAGQSPGAALLCLSFTPNSLGILRGPPDIHAAYENALVEIASSLHLSRNIFVALLSFQSWKSFMRRWMRANILVLDAKAAAGTLDKTSKAANKILKGMMRLAEESIPRSAENIALAVGALCLVLPPSAHTIKSTASKFLLNWLFQDEHEHRQWSAAISLGFISSCLHITDHKQKFQNITGLLKVLCSSKSTLVKGACGVGLGCSCQDLLTRVEAVDNIDLERETYKIQEVELLGKIVRTLLLMTSQLSQASDDILKGLSVYFPQGTDDSEISMTSELLLEKCDDLEEDIWGVAGIVIGLGNSIGAMYRVGAHDSMLKVKDLIISWIPHVDSLAINSDFSNEGVDKVLSVGSCLVLPIIVAFCRRVEMMDDNELDRLVNVYIDLISELVSVKKSGTFHQSLLTASCIGAGNLLACILNEAVHPIEFEHIKDLLDLFRKCYSNPYPAFVHLGGMLGVVNAMGASAGILFHGHRFSSSVKTGYEQKESSYILGPLLSSPNCESHLTTLIQEIFLVAQNSGDLQMKQNASWAVSFLRNLLWSKELPYVNNNVQTGGAESKMVSHNFSEDSLVMKLSLWLNHLNYSLGGKMAPVGTVATVLRCLSAAPRLPTMDWGSIIRRCMRFEAQVSESLTLDLALKRENLREECVQFAIAHAHQCDPLLTFLDELSDLSRFRTLELNLQSCLLAHLAGLTKIFSGSRLEKLFDDIAEFFSSNSSHQVHNSDQKSTLRMSCWKGLYQCLDEASLSSLEYMPNVEKCMEVMFYLLPASESTAILGSDLVNPVKEWHEVVKCLAKVRRDWLLNFLQVPLLNLVEGDVQLDEILKKIVAKAKLVRIGIIPFTELGRLKACILNSKSHGIWNVLVEVVAALQYAEGSIKRQWLLDAVEVSCVSSYPSTALQFLGLLSGSCCKYMPLLTLDRLTVLSDLPVTLTSLLMEPSWEVVAESVVSYLYASTERIYGWVTNTVFLDGSTSVPPVDESENNLVTFILHTMHHTCLSLKEYLPLEKQLRLASMVIQ